MEIETPDLMGFTLPASNDIDTSIKLQAFTKYTGSCSTSGQSPASP